MPGSGPLPYRSGPRAPCSYVDDLRFSTTLGPCDRPRGRFGQPLAAMECRRPPGLGPRRRPQGPLPGQETSLVAIADRFRQEDAFKDAGTARYHGRRRGCMSPRPRSSCTGRANGMWARRRSRSLGHHCRCGWSSPRSATPKGRVLGPLAVADQRAGGLGRRRDDRSMVLLPLANRELMHKLLKSAGWQLESWLQRDGHRLLIKLLLALGRARRSGRWSGVTTPSRRRSSDC